MSMSHKANQGQVFVWEKPPLQVVRREVLPSARQKRLRCGNCGKVEFQVHIAIEGSDFGRVDDLVCLCCKTVYKVDPQGRLAGKQE
jgi:hypothetical protein